MLDLIPLIISFFVMLAFPVILIGAGYLILSNLFKNNKQRTRDFQSFAGTAKLNYIGAGNLSNIPGAQYFRICNLGNGYGRQFENAFSGMINGFRVTVFDYTFYDTVSFKKIFNQTVMMIESPGLNLPLFFLRPKGKGLFQKMGNAFNNNIKFPSDQEFSDKYILNGRDEPAIRHIFNHQVLSHLDTIESFNLEGGGNRILFYQDEIVFPPNQLNGMLVEGLKIAGLFVK